VPCRRRAALRIHAFGAIVAFIAGDRRVPDASGVSVDLTTGSGWSIWSRG
jgi:hypothetical protein